MQISAGYGIITVIWEKNRESKRTGGGDHRVRRDIMTENEIKKLSRSDLLEILVEQSREIDNLNEVVAKLRSELEDRRIDIKSAGSIAEAALKVNGVFEAAQRAAQQYLDNVKRLDSEHGIFVESQRRRLEARVDANEKKASEIISEAERRAAEIIAEAEKKAERIVSEAGKAAPGAPEETDPAETERTGSRSRQGKVRKGR